MMVLLAGCPRVLHLDYRPSTSFKGSGPVRVDSFMYAGHPTGLMKQKELQTGAKDPAGLLPGTDGQATFAPRDLQAGNKSAAGGRLVFPCTVEHKNLFLEAYIMS